MKPGFDHPLMSLNESLLMVEVETLGSYLGSAFLYHAWPKKKI